MELQNKMETSSHEAKKNGNVRFYKAFNVQLCRTFFVTVKVSRV